MTRPSPPGSRPTPSRASNSAISAPPSPRLALRTLPLIRTTAASGISPPLPVGSGKPSITATPGIPFSIMAAPIPSAASRLIPKIPTPSGSAPAKVRPSAASVTAMAFTKAPTVAKLGSTSAWPTPSISRKSSSIPGIPMSPTPPVRARFGRPAATADSTKPPTVAKPGSPFFKSPRTPA